MARHGGGAIGHISQEATEGGLPGLVKEGDTITIDIPGQKLNLEISEEETQRRQSAWIPPEPKVKQGYLPWYAKWVTSASTSTVLKV